MELRDVILHPKNVRVLVLLKQDGKKWYASSLAKEAGLSYVHVSELLDSFAHEGLLKAEKEGRIKRVTLTENGLKVANALDELVSRLNLIVPAPQSQAKVASA